jgi:hypothetical protein
VYDTFHHHEKIGKPNNLKVNKELVKKNNKRNIYIYIYIRRKNKPNSVRIRFLYCHIFVLPSTGFDLIPLIHCSTIPQQNKKLTAQRSHSNTVWFNFQTYIIISINLVSQVTLRSSGTDILYGCHLLRCLYNILYFL